MMYDELIRQMRACCNGEPCKEANCGFNPKSNLDCIEQLLTRAADAIEDLDNKLNLYRQGKISHWIPVTERLPEKSGWYLTFVCNKWQGSLSDQKVSIWDGERFHVGSFAIVTHWMPLPEPPESECE